MALDSVEGQLYDTFRHLAPNLLVNPNDEGRQEGAKKHKSNHEERSPQMDQVISLLHMVRQLTLRHDRALEADRRVDT